MAKQNLCDRKFVIAAVVIGSSYALMVALVGRMLGKDAAGVAGIALTALPTALLRQFETLRFRKMSENDSVCVDVPRVNFTRVTTITFAFMGAQYLFGVAVGLLPETWLSEEVIVVLVILATLLSYFIISLLVAKAFVPVRYSTVAFAVLISQIASVLVGAVAFRPALVAVLQYGLGPVLGSQGAICLGFEVVALLGVRLGLPNQAADRPQIESSAAVPTY